MRTWWCGTISVWICSGSDDLEGREIWENSEGPCSYKKGDHIWREKENILQGLREQRKARRSQDVVETTASHSRGGQEFLANRKRAASLGSPRTEIQRPGGGGAPRDMKCHRERLFAAQDGTNLFGKRNWRLAIDGLCLETPGGCLSS